MATFVYTIGIVIVVFLIAAACGNPFAGWVRPVPIIIEPAPTAIPRPPAAPTAVPAQPQPGQQGIVAEASSWCRGNNCSPSRFEPLREANGTINPNGVHMKTGNPVEVHLPAGVTADVWDCYKAYQVSGPARLTQVCEMTVRRF